HLSPRKWQEQSTTRGASIRAALWGYGKPLDVRAGTCGRTTTARPEDLLRAESGAAQCRRRPQGEAAFVRPESRRTSAQWVWIGVPRSVRWVWMVVPPSVRWVWMVVPPSVR